MSRDERLGGTLGRVLPVLPALKNCHEQGLGSRGLVWDGDTIGWCDWDTMECRGIGIPFNAVLECCRIGTPWNYSGISWIAVGLGYQGLLWDCFSSDPSCSPCES